MNPISRIAAFAGMAALLSMLPAQVPAACQDGHTSSCTRNGCAGVRECIGGRMQGCEVAEQCVRPPPPPVRDKVIVDLVVPGKEVGILFDGTDSQGTFNDRSVIVTANTTSTTAVLPNIQAPAFGNSVIAFAQSRQPRIWPAPWTANADTVYVPLQNNLRFKVTFWILAGTFTTQQTNAATAVLAVNNAYTVEKAGARIAFVTVNEAMANPNARALLNWTGQTADQYTNGIGFAMGDINVYVVDNINGASIMGLNYDGTPVIIFARDTLTFPQLLEHEIGHAFVLWHTAGLSGFNSENVMWPSVSAHYLTEGQNFRMHFHPSSQINVFGLRPGQPTFICGEPMTNDCPANNRRLWADGSLPPN